MINSPGKQVDSSPALLCFAMKPARMNRFGRGCLSANFPINHNHYFVLLHNMHAEVAHNTTQYLVMNLAERHPSSRSGEGPGVRTKKPGVRPLQQVRGITKSK